MIEDVRFHLIGYREEGEHYRGGGEYEHRWDSDFVLERDLTADEAINRATQLMAWEEPPPRFGTRCNRFEHDYENYKLHILPSVADRPDPDESWPPTPNDDACQAILDEARKRAQLIVEKRIEDYRWHDERGKQIERAAQEAKERAELKRLADKYSQESKT